MNYVQEEHMSIKILLADDSITIQKVVGIIFGGDEYSLTVVDNGKSAVEKARELNPDVLLIDALMPGMSGYEVCEAVRATPALANKPILLLTGSFEPFDEDKAKSCGADDFLAKPFESQQIITKVKELMEQGSARTSEATAAEPAESPAAVEASAANDIWGAFTEPEEAAAATAVEEPAPVEDVLEVENATGSQWIPVEEETFAFEEKAAAREHEPSVEETMFGDVEFEAPSGEAEAEEAAPAPEPPAAATEPEEVAFEEPAVEAEPEEVAFEEPVAAVVAAPVAAAAPVEMSEDQLRAAIMGASREVIERIVWEVVPDLAEVMIREAIEKIKRGE
jgi:CheY-like chemotaxis protein